MFFFGLVVCLMSMLLLLLLLLFDIGKLMHVWTVFGRWKVVIWVASSACHVDQKSMVKLFTNLTCEHVVVSLPLPVLETKIFYSNINNKKIPQKMVLDSASFAQVGFNAVLLFVAFCFRG